LVSQRYKKILNNRMEPEISLEIYMKSLNVEREGFMKTGERIKIILIIVFCVLLDVFLHMLTAPYGTIPDNPALSVISQMIGVEATASFWALLAFSVVAFVYWRIRDDIPGKNVGKGMRYGTVVASLWFLGMLEGVSLFGNPIIKEVIVGLSDAIPVFLMCLLLSLVSTAKDSVHYQATLFPRQTCKVISLFAVQFLAGRYIAYSTGAIKSGIHDMPLETFAWTLLVGIAIGSSFVLLGNYRHAKSMIHRAGRFSFLIFGMNWAVFLVFMPLLFSGYTTDVFIRIVLDTTLVMIASCWTNNNVKK